MATAIDRIESTVKSFRDGTHESIRPGMPFRIPDAWDVDDAGAQGDLVFVIVDAIPAGYVHVENPTDADRQLVHGNTEGSRHCLDSLAGVTMYRPADWNEESLDGPMLQIAEDRIVNHPTHGPWTIPAGRMIKCEYPLVWDAVQREERRNAD